MQWCHPCQQILHVAATNIWHNRHPQFELRPQVTGLPLLLRAGKWPLAFPWTDCAVWCEVLWKRVCFPRWSFWSKKSMACMRTDRKLSVEWWWNIAIFRLLTQLPNGGMNCVLPSSELTLTIGIIASKQFDSDIEVMSQSPSRYLYFYTNTCVLLCRDCIG